MQEVQNTAACHILRAPRHQNCTSSYSKSPGSQFLKLMQYKTARMCFNAITGSAPTYRYLCSSSDTHMLKLQRFSCKTMAFTPFSHFGPRIWNNLPQETRHSATPLSWKANSRSFSSPNMRWATLSFTHIGLYNARADKLQISFYLSVHTLCNINY